MYSSARHPIRSTLRRLVTVRRPHLLSQPTVRTMADMPVPQSSKAVLFDGHPKSEGWETTMAVWYGTSLLLLIATLGMTPETEIETWAKQEAAARLATSDQIEFGKHYYSPSQMQKQEQPATHQWDKHSAKATKWLEDDDDDDEDE